MDRGNRKTHEEHEADMECRGLELKYRQQLERQKRGALFFTLGFAIACLMAWVFAWPIAWFLTAFLDHFVYKKTGSKALFIGIIIGGFVGHQVFGEPDWGYIRSYDTRTSLAKASKLQRESQAVDAEECRYVWVTKGLQGDFGCLSGLFNCT